ncbi:MAG: hypothetical protein K2X81_14700, partial [Candidatus Obscuribacterales bacterium]|nr:hypothetical protein [Candidatus Obscuribacterales bacterium]
MPTDHYQISASDLSAWFLGLFPNRISSVVRHTPTSKWHEVSRFHVLGDEDILECVRLNNKFQRGFRFESTTRFLVMQIAADSPYRNPEGIAEIRSALSS